MPETTHSTPYWQPVTHGTSAVASVREYPLCANCNTELVLGSRFCHNCGVVFGHTQSKRFHFSAIDWHRWLDHKPLQAALRLPLLSLVAFGIALLSMFAALTVGLFYSANTALEWQAIQTWRMEWMMVAIVALLAGILLKESRI